MSKLSKQTKQILQAAGWSETRDVDPGVYRRVLEAEGYPVHPCVEEFLRSFASIRAFFTTPQGEDNDFFLDPVEAVDFIYMERVAEDYSPRVGMPLCVIGLYHHDNMVLLMDSGGGVYGGHDETLLHVADSAEEAIEAMIMGAEFTEITKTPAD